MGPLSSVLSTSSLELPRTRCHRMPKMDHNYYPRARLLSHIDNALNTFPVIKAGRAEAVEAPCVSALLEMDRFVRAVQLGDALPYVLQGRYFKAEKLPRSDTEGVSNWDPLFATVRRWGRVDVPYLRFAPHLKLLMEVYRQHRISVGMYNGPNAPFYGGERNAEVFNDFCLAFRRAMADRKMLRQECLTWGLGSTQNLRRLHRYLDAFTGATPSTTAYHFTFLHTTEPLNLATASEKAHLAYLEPLRACRSLFMNGFAGKPSLFPSKPGYVWSLEPSLSGGWGLRMTLLWPTEVISRVSIGSTHHARGIGDYWVQHATKTFGSYLMHGTEQVFELTTPSSGRRVSYGLQSLKMRLAPLAVRDALVRFDNQPEGKYFGMPQLMPRRSRAVDGPAAQE